MSLTIVYIELYEHDLILAGKCKNCYGHVIMLHLSDVIILL